MNRKQVVIPATIEAATEVLTGIESLLTAKGWERAAIVYAFTEDKQGTRTDLLQKGSSEVRLGIAEFAALGIAGLTSAPTVRMYRQAWIDGKGRQSLRPGEEAILPSGPFPPTDKRTGNFDERVETQVRNAKPEVREKILEEFIESSPEMVTEVVSEHSEMVTAIVRKAAEKIGSTKDTETAEPSDTLSDLWRVLSDLQGLVASLAFDEIDGDVRQEIGNTLRNMAAFVDPAYESEMR